MVGDSCIYFAYGSNLHPFRLQERVPSARLLGLARLADHKLIYGKRGIDGSGKCTTTFARGVTSCVIGALFALRADELGALDAAEGPAYGRKTTVFSLGGSDLAGFYYEAHDYSVDSDLLPFDWYRDLVVAGARFHKMPAAYVAALENVPTLRDPNQDRHAQMQALLARMSCI